MRKIGKKASCEVGVCEGSFGLTRTLRARERMSRKSLAEGMGCAEAQFPQWAGFNVL